MAACDGMLLFAAAAENRQPTVALLGSVARESAQPTPMHMGASSKRDGYKQRSAVRAEALI